MVELAGVARVLAVDVGQQLLPVLLLVAHRQAVVRLLHAADARERVLVGEGFLGVAVGREFVLAHLHHAFEELRRLHSLYPRDKQV